MNGQEINATQVAKWEQLANSYLTDMNYLPNNNQLGVSIAAVHKFAKYKRQFYLVPPGMGKSRIIAAFATIMSKAYKKDLTGIYIAFSS